MRSPLLTLALSVAMPLTAAAHDVVSGPHGGPVVDASGHHIEFTANGDQVTFYLTDEAQKPIASAGAKGSAIVQQGGKTGTVALTPVAPNVLQGRAPRPIAAGARVVISAKMSDGHAIQARFVKK